MQSTERTVPCIVPCTLDGGMASPGATAKLGALTVPPSLPLSHWIPPAKSSNPSRWRKSRLVGPAAKIRQAAGRPLSAPAVKLCLMGAHARTALPVSLDPCNAIHASASSTTTKQERRPPLLVVI